MVSRLLAVKVCRNCTEIFQFPSKLAIMFSYYHVIINVMIRACGLAVLLCFGCLCSLRFLLIQKLLNESATPGERQAGRIFKAVLVQREMESRRFR